MPLLNRVGILNHLQKGYQNQRETRDSTYVSL